MNAEIRLAALEAAVLELLDRLIAAEMMVTALNREQARIAPRSEQGPRVQ